ncbi:MAG: hypothetical protein KME20_08630 [Kaiparowitsia implicata GSE-PSE-MK54-09C]|nr:hypothetical protein [Kaiparowitsia implicata GSE-PSE-MK54-09C]
MAQTPTHTEIELVAQSPTGACTRYGGVVAADCQPPLILHGECSSRPDEVYEFPQFELIDPISIDPISIVPITDPAC